MQQDTNPLLVFIVASDVDVTKQRKESNHCNKFLKVSTVSFLSRYLISLKRTQFRYFPHLELFAILSVGITDIYLNGLTYYIRRSASSPVRLSPITDERRVDIRQY